ncbi:hypothetical protein [Longimicrobium terrae]|uniref:Uncharacterized protein n=1 Tax=Longimicrobium terrae TaxID=1639882 RepID=A0A841H7B2_9BACT|nr:hypothetical protein [Longimicrobium terrae]MBB4637885.1 hypothetical protein [Longimicrobium terrae]MBB6074020.1 hypothetical protein [Longimicrobium terrae]NNC31181.1 hypothetical protein [Longimicrobium terrae]
MPHDGLFSWGLALKAGAALMVLMLVITLSVLRGRAHIRQELDEDDELR